MNRHLLLCVAACLAAVVPAVGQPGGEPISIVNPGFEADDVSRGCFEVFTPGGWTVYDPNGIGDCCSDVVGGLHPEGSPYFPGGTPEGDNVALVFLSGNLEGGHMGLTQVLAEVLQPDTTYTLSVWVGNIASGQGPPPCDMFGYFHLDGFPGYRVELLAGGVVVAADDNTLAGSIPEGHFRLSTIRLNVGESHAQLGTSLEVRLINLNMIDQPATPGIEVDFDDIRLVRGCPAHADIDGDGTVGAGDVAAFVGALLEQNDNPMQVIRSDLNCSGMADGDDLFAFVQLLY